MDREHAAWGVILIVIGVILLGQRLDWGINWNMGRLWPLIVVALGVLQLVARRFAAAVWMLLSGGLFFLHMNHILRLDRSWPLFIVVAGLGMLFRRPGRRRVQPVVTAAEAPPVADGEKHE